jgi:hypothetical protein
MWRGDLMGRLKRAIHNSLTVLSLVLALLAVGLWVTSGHCHYRVLRQDSSKTSYHLDCREGRIWATIQYSAFYPDSGAGIIADVRPVGGPMHFTANETFLERRGFWIKTKSEDWTEPPPADWQSPRWIALLGMSRDKRVSLLSVGAPVWFLVVLTAVAPVQKLLRTLTIRRRTRQGQCPACGYDLRATPDRCPECGETSRIAGAA